MDTRGVFFSGKTKYFLSFLEHLYRMLNSSLFANFLLTKICLIWVITYFRGSPKKPLDLTYFENGRGQHIPCTVQLDAQSLNAPLLPVAIYSSHEAGRTTTTTICRQQHTTPTPHHTQPPNQQRTAHDMTRHFTTKNKDTHVHAHVNGYKCFLRVHVVVYVHVFVHVHLFV